MHQGFGGLSDLDWTLPFSMIGSLPPGNASVWRWGSCSRRCVFLSEFFFPPAYVAVCVPSMRMHHADMRLCGRRPQWCRAELLDDETEPRWARAYSKEGMLVRVRRTEKEGELGYHHRSDPWHKLRTPPGPMLLPVATLCWSAREMMAGPAARSVSTSLGGCRSSSSGSSTMTVTGSRGSGGWR